MHPSYAALVINLGVALAPIVFRPLNSVETLSAQKFPWAKWVKEWQDRVSAIVTVSASIDIHGFKCQRHTLTLEYVSVTMTPLCQVVSLQYGYFSEPN